ncbi:MAG: hypothetical protein B7C24_05500 [Bacteroidetes bacterium 4572_77]|nr:MAG: hypothetical protein B7C24_05500 [Bacteroidetes bacterium 4572_77]
MQDKPIIELISHIHLTNKRYLENKISAKGLSIKQYFLLKILKNRNLTPSDISEMLYADRPTTTVIINNLMKKGFINKEANPTDSRSKIISISKTGQQKLQEFKDLEKEKIKATSCLDKQEKQSLKELLLKVSNNLQKQIYAE